MDVLPVYLMYSAMAGAIQSGLREGNVFCRYGGEEFCVLLPDADVRSAERTAEGFRQAVASLDISGLHVTVSLGISSLGLGAGSAQELLEQADKALYAAKGAGRNRVIRWDLLPEPDRNRDDARGRKM